MIVEKLMNCPFCGSDSFLNDLEEDPILYAAACSNKRCGISTMVYGDKKSCMDAWNHRVEE